jgi:hypothetical protein
MSGLVVGAGLLGSGVLAGGGVLGGGVFGSGSCSAWSSGPGAGVLDSGSSMVSCSLRDARSCNAPLSAAVVAARLGSIAVLSAWLASVLLSSAVSLSGYRPRPCSPSLRTYTNLLRPAWLAGMKAGHDWCWGSITLVGVAAITVLPVFTPPEDPGFACSSVLAVYYHCLNCRKLCPRRQQIALHVNPHDKQGYLISVASNLARCKAAHYTALASVPLLCTMMPMSWHADAARQECVMLEDVAPSRCMDRVQHCSTPGCVCAMQ